MVTSDGHMLQTADGRPFFWLGDTAWELIHRTTPDEARFYLRTRARQGFTVVQTVVLAEFDGLRTPTPDGLLPFREADPTQPNDAYFDRVAAIVDAAAAEGLYVALLPCWGDKLTAPWGEGPRIFTAANLPAARAYGRYLAQRLTGRTNVIWMLGGDRPATLKTMTGAPAWFADNAAKAGFARDADWTPVWAAMAQGLRDADRGAHLIAYHPQGGPLSTSQLLGAAPWLQINGIQSGHGGGHDVPVWDWIARDVALTPPRPTLDLEPNYEDHPYNPWPQWNPASGYFRDYDVRKQVWRSVLAGAAGVTYGHHAVWGFVGARYPAINFADRDWLDALHRPGAEQMRYLRDLLLLRPYRGRLGAPDLVQQAETDGASKIVAARGADASYAFVYFPRADQSATIAVDRLGARAVSAWWYDPRNGSATPVAEVDATAPHRFTTPSYGPDWVLVIDDANRHRGPPGMGPAVR